MRTPICFAILLAAAALAGCQRGESPALQPFRADVLSRAFEVDALADGRGTNYRMHVEPLGRLSLPTGKICAAEPFTVRDLEAFTMTVPPGQYPAQVAIADSGNDPRVAFARVKFSEERPVQWRLAVWPHSRIRPGKDPFVGYAVDGGLGSFMDAAAVADLKKLHDNQGFYRELTARFLTDGTRTQFAMLPTEHANVAVFATGIGDGAYASYFGFGASGKPVVLVTDFGMIRWEPVRGQE